MKTSVMSFNQLFANSEDSLEAIVNVYKNKINSEVENLLSNLSFKNYTEIYFDNDEWTGQIYIKFKEREIHFSLKSPSLIDLKDQVISKIKNEINSNENLQLFRMRH